MNNRELLEMAAKAAGKDNYRWHHEDQAMAMYNNSMGCWYTDRHGEKYYWNPLTDDGDAFRLASKLLMTVEFGNSLVLHPVEIMGLGTDALAATRLAIVKCAAEIGRAMG